VTTILLARHGETDWNRENRFQGHADPPLNERGRAQAGALAERLTSEAVAAIYASPLRRARETAEIIGARIGLSVESVAALREVDVGSWSGLTRAEIEQRFPDGYRRWLGYGPGWDDGETYEEMGERVLGALGELAARHPAERILVVTHGGPIRAAHAHALGITHGEARRLRSVMGNCDFAGCVAENGSLRWLD
jgi:broad specificity phosphatase PhoE